VSRKSPSQRRRQRGQPPRPAAAKPASGRGAAAAAGKDPRPPASASRRTPREWGIDIAIMLGAFVVVSAIAGALGAANLGTALSFGQIGFGIALVWVLVRR
jgi:hypothetical protein